LDLKNTTKFNIIHPGSFASRHNLHDITDGVSCSFKDKSIFSKNKKVRKGSFQREEKIKGNKTEHLFAGNNLDWPNVYRHIFASC
jgi:hypothetical protein